MFAGILISILVIFWLANNYRQYHAVRTYPSKKVFSVQRKEPAYVYRQADGRYVLRIDPGQDVEPEEIKVSEVLHQDGGLPGHRSLRVWAEECGTL